MVNARQIVTGVVLLSLGAVGGYYLAPTEKVTVEKVVVREVEKAKTDRNIVTKRVVTKAPDGTSRTEETIVDKSKDSSEKDTVARSETMTRTTRRQPQWALTGGVFVDSRGNREIFGGLERQIIGPISVGVFATQGGQVGAGVTLRF